MWQLALQIFTIVTTILALAYAHRSHRRSVNAPVLKLELITPDGACIEAPKQPIDITLRLNRAEATSSLTQRSEEARGYPLRFAVRNIGTKTARGITLRARYSNLLEIMSTGRQTEDIDRKEWIVIDHSIPDLNPKQSHKLDGDYFLPTDLLINGIAIDTSVTTKDRKKLRVKARAEMAAIIEILLYSADTEPSFLSCRVEVAKDPRKNNP